MSGWGGGPSARGVKGKAAPLVGDLVPQALVLLDEGTLLLRKLVKLVLQGAEHPVALLLGEEVEVDDGAEDLDETLGRGVREVVEGEVAEAAWAGELLAVGERGSR